MLISTYISKRIRNKHLLIKHQEEMKNVLIVDDSMFIRAQVKEILVANGYNVVGEASNGEEAIDMALELQPDLITLDNVLPDMLGIEILRVFKKHNVTSKIVMISAVGQKSMQEKALELGASNYVVKPIVREVLEQTVHAAIQGNKLSIAA